MAVSTLTALEPKFGFSQVDESLCDQLSSIRLHDDAPNNPDLQHRDLQPSDPGSENSKEEESATGLEFDLAGPIDQLTLFCKEEEEDRLLDAHGGGYKRPQTGNQQGEGVPAKRSLQRASLQTCSPPQQAVYLSFNSNGYLASSSVQVFSTGKSSLPSDVSSDGAATEKALQISRIKADLMSLDPKRLEGYASVSSTGSASVTPTFVPSPPPSLSHSIPQPPSVSSSAMVQSVSSTSVAEASSKLPMFASPEEPLARERLTSDMLGSKQSHNNMQLLTQGKKLPLAGARLRNVPSLEPQNSPQSFNQLRNPPLTEADIHTELHSQPFNNNQQRDVSNTNTPCVQSKRPKGPPNEGLTQNHPMLVGPPGFQFVKDIGRTIVSTPSLTSLPPAGPPDVRSYRIPVSSTQATGPPNMGQRAHPPSTVGPPTVQNTSSSTFRDPPFLQTSRTTTLTRTSESDVPSSPRVQGPYPGRSFSESIRGRSLSGETIRTCINNKPMSGGRVMCNDMSPPIIPPSPISPFSNDSVFGSSPPRNLSDQPSSSHVSPAYSFPPTPESDCSSMKGSPTQIADVEPCPSPSNRSLQASPGYEGMGRDVVDSARQNSHLSSSSSSELYYPQPVSMGQHLQASLPSEGVSGHGMDSGRQNCSSSSAPYFLHPVSTGHNFLDTSSSSSSPVPWYPHPVSLTLPTGSMMMSSHVVPDNFLHKLDREGERELEEEEMEKVLSFVRDENGAFRVDEDGDTFFHSLSGLENEQEAVMYLHRLRASPDFLQGLNAYNKLWETPLYNAVSFGKRTLVEALLKLGADVNRQCHYGPKAHSPLHKAVEEGDYSIVDLLLRSPAMDLTAKRACDDCTALMAAVKKHVCGDPHTDRYNIIARIIQQEDTPNLQIKEPRSGKTALMMAVETKDKRVVDVLLSDLDVDIARHLINIPNRAGNSAVHMAAGLRDVPQDTKEQILGRLIRLGGETNKRNNEGETPKDWAKNLIDRVARFR